MEPSGDSAPLLYSREKAKCLTDPKSGEIRDPKPVIESAATCPDSETAMRKARCLSLTSVRGEMVSISLARSSNGKQAFGESGDGFVWRVAVAFPARKSAHLTIGM